jgi:hypothetical protein
VRYRPSIQSRIYGRKYRPAVEEMP